MPFTFDMILKSEGIEPATVQMVRHQDTRYGSKRSPYALWRTAPTDFEKYQAIQKREVFRVGGLLASFVVAPKQSGTLFVGLYEIRDKGVVPSGEIDPLGRHDVAGLNLYDLMLDGRLRQYEGKLVIDWGLGLRSWVQRAGRVPKPILELRSKVHEPDFPGFLHLREQLSSIPSLPTHWIERLSEAKGVYVLTCPTTKELYVGSATGEGGFFERWAQHFKAGGDAAMLRSRDPSNYQVSILEIAGSNALERDILHAEYLWMKKLQTNEMGLNGGMLRDGRKRTIEDSCPLLSSASRP